MPCALDGRSEHPLRFGAVARGSSWEDFAPLRDELSQAA